MLKNIWICVRFFPKCERTLHSQFFPGIYFIRILWECVNSLGWLMVYHFLSNSILALATFVSLHVRFIIQKAVGTFIDLIMTPFTDYSNMSIIHFRKKGLALKQNSGMPHMGLEAANICLQVDLFKQHIMLTAIVCHKHSSVKSVLRLTVEFWFINIVTWAVNNCKK